MTKTEQTRLKTWRLKVLQHAGEAASAPDCPHSVPVSPQSWSAAALALGLIRQPQAQCVFRCVGAGVLDGREALPPGGAGPPGRVTFRRFPKKGRVRLIECPR